MSKSLGNIYTLRDIEDKGFNPQAFRLLVLSSHYRNESNFSWEIIEAAQKRLQNWRSMFNRRWQRNILTDDQPDISDDILESLRDDLGTPMAIAKVDTYFDSVDSAGAMPSRDTLLTIRDILGIDVLDYDISDDQKLLMKEREAARDSEDWARVRIKFVMN